MKNAPTRQAMILHGSGARPLAMPVDGLVLRYGEAPGPFGVCRIVDSQWGIYHLSFDTPADEVSLPEEIRRDWPQARLLRDDDHVRSLADAIFNESGSVASPPPLVIAGTPFQNAVWRALLEIPVGATVSYGKLAASLGQPRASRAVGATVGANRIAWLIPCHRVLRADGMIGGYRWGVERKSAMLAWEKARLT